MGVLAKACFPYRVADSRDWSDTVSVGRDFCVTYQNHFAVVFSWSYGSQLFAIGAIGKYLDNRLEYVGLGPGLLTDSTRIRAYFTMRDRDSSWTLLSQTDPRAFDAQRWEEPLRDPRWMCDYYGKQDNMLIRTGLDRVFPRSSRKSVPPELGTWFGEIGFVAFEHGPRLLQRVQDSTCIDCTVDWVEYHGDIFASIMSLRSGGQRIYQAIAGRHFGDSIVYRRLLDGPRLVAGQEFNQYTHLRRADSLWTLVGPREWWESERSLQQMFDQAGAFYARDSADVYRFPLR
jgi:hypothetical protein